MPARKLKGLKMIFLIFLTISVFLIKGAQAQEIRTNRLLNSADFNYLKGLTSDVMDSARIYSGQIISNDFGANSTGITLIRPGGRDSYPAFWIRDYAMSIETGFVTNEEQKKNAFINRCYAV